jgi:hypothetical protein
LVAQHARLCADSGYCTYIPTLAALHPRELRQELERLRAAAKQYDIQVDDPDDILNAGRDTGFPPSDDEMSPSPRKQESKEGSPGPSVLRADAGAFH